MDLNPNRDPSQSWMQTHHCSGNWVVMGSWAISCLSPGGLNPLWKGSPNNNPGCLSHGHWGLELCVCPQPTTKCNIHLHDQITCSGHGCIPPLQGSCVFLAKRRRSSHWQQNPTEIPPETLKPYGKQIKKKKYIKKTKKATTKQTKPKTIPENSKTKPTKKPKQNKPKIPLFI